MYIKVRAQAGAKKEELKTVSKDTLAIKVREPAERNLANARLKIIVASYFSVPVSQVRLVSGHHSPSKIFSVGM